MYRAIRLYGALLLVAIYTLPLMGAQWLALRTGWPNERIAPRLWHRLTLRVLGIRVRRRGKLARNGPLMIVANHVSWTDILVLGSLSGVHFIAKSEVRSWPVLGTFAKLQRSVFVEREKRGTSPEQAREIAARLADGDPIVLFAEGTTGDGNRVLPFKSTLFGAAQLALSALHENQVRVQPVAIAYARKAGLPLDRRERGRIAWIGDMNLFPHLWEILHGGALDVEVRFGDPIAFPADGSRKEIARKAEEAVRHLLITALRGRES